eukprot:gene9493-1734_t
MDEIREAVQHLLLGETFEDVTEEKEPLLASFDVLGFVNYIQKHNCELELM